MKIETIPFGKYKGQPVEVLQSDAQYLEWLRNQDWFISRYPQINQVIINNFGEPTDSPEHNALVARFTDKTFCIATIIALYNVTNEGIDDVDIDSSYISTDFEVWKGNDISLTYSIKRISGKIGLPKPDDLGKTTAHFFIECKPHISDDFPSIIRQCKSQNTNIVVYQTFGSKAVGLESVKNMFGGIVLISLDEINTYYNRLLER